jgi:hypothetical protein
MCSWRCDRITTKLASAIYAIGKLAEFKPPGARLWQERNAKPRAAYVLVATAPSRASTESKPLHQALAVLEATAIDAIRECRRRIWSSGCCKVCRRALGPPRHDRVVLGTAKIRR